MLIDKIILAKTDFVPNDFTGGNIQFSVSKYKKTMDINLNLYFGFNAVRNSISRQIKIKEEDVEILTKELLKKTKAYEQSLFSENDILSLNEFTKDSYECNTNIVRSSSSDIGNVISDNKVNDRDNIPAIPKGITQDILDSYFDIIWTEHSNRLKQIKTKSGLPRRNENKSKTKTRFIALLNKYKYESICCYVRNEILRDTPKELLNLFGRELDKDLLRVIDIQSQDILDEALESDNNNFLDFMESIKNIM